MNMIDDFRSVPLSEFHDYHHRRIQPGPCAICDRWIEGPMKKIIHILSAGRALCGRAGAPVTWDPGESWVGPVDAHQATCPACIETTGFSIAALKKQRRKK